MRRLVILLLVLGMPFAAGAAPACNGALARSCAKKLFRCFKPKGTCVAELTFGPDGVHTLQCWENGARLSIDASLSGGTIDYRGPRGKKCLRGQVVVESEDVAYFVFTKKKKTWQIRTLEDDSLQITCPDGSVETWTEAEVNTQPPSCGGFSDASACTMGDCP